MYPAMGRKEMIRFSANIARIRFGCTGLLILLLMGVPVAIHAAGYPVAFTDDSGTDIVIREKPSRVVSLVPSMTEIIFRLGAGDAVAGITHHSTHPPEVAGRTIVGGFSAPSLEHVERLEPDLIFCSPIQKGVRERFAGTTAIPVNLETDSIADSCETIRLLGRIFDRETEAAGIISENDQLLSIIKQKVAKIPPKKRRRVIRLMGRDRIMTPGDDSFQNELIRAAGGVPPALGKTGGVVPVSLDEWQAFNPQFIYGCGGDTAVAERFFKQPGWGNVDAVKTHTVRYFPCDLTCRCATHTGYFVSWLSARIYPDLYGEAAYQVLENGIRSQRDLALSVSYVKKTTIAHSKMDDFDNKTLVLDLDRPMTVVSTLEGQRSGITAVGNHYSSPPCWGIGHNRGLEEIRKRVYRVIGKTEDSASFLFTGADMDNISIQTEQFREMRVHALVTAGVRSNAVRMARDTGNYYEPGTINVILLPEMKLTPRAMARAIISATEGKTASLLDMDIRSTYGARKYRATGTGTDNIIVVEGTGARIDNAGGHSKMGELIARAVYKGVQEAIYRQNGMIPGRNVFHRLKERHISLHGLLDRSACDCLPGGAEAALLEPAVANFIHMAFAVSDEYEKGLIRDLSAFDAACRHTAEDIAGKPVPAFRDLVAPENLPPVLETALNALLNGVYHRQD